MTTSNAIGSATHSASGSPATAASAGGSGGVMQTLTANDFLTLMTAQLKNQDPLNPTDSNQFLSQLAQLSTVTGISSMSSTMSTLSNALLSSQALTSAALVGHSVLTTASSATFTSGQGLAGAVQVPANAGSVTVTISDASGTPVRHIAVPAGAGLQGFQWDGTTDAGSAAGSGVYSIAASVNSGGTNQAATTLINATVTSVSLGANGSGVTLNTAQLGPVALSSVQQIS